MTNYIFDDVNIKWHTLVNFEHLHYAILDDDLNIIATLGFQDFINLYKEQIQP